MVRKPSKKERQEISAGIEKEVKEFEKTGQIKTSRATYHPQNKQKAIKQAAAIEYGKHRIGRAGEKAKKK